MNASQFPWTKEQLADKIRLAVKAYWAQRQKQAKTQAAKKTKDAGTRGEVTGGQHLNAFADLFITVIGAAGYGKPDIHVAKPLVLPGYYRAQKKWDIVVTRGSRLVAAIELKSQSGSFGNNLNNRTEEVIGLSRDFWVAYREKAFGLAPQPWLGYFFLLEDSPKSTKPVRVVDSPFPAFPIFNDASYWDRYRILCERLVLERDYSATALVASPKAAQNGTYREPNADLSLYCFAQSLFAHLVAHR